ncbi:MAG: hypothetical protein ACRCWM_01790 [Sarcina sp.]
MITALIRFFKKRINITSSDERIEKETNSVYVRGYIISQIVALLVIIGTLIARISLINLIIPVAVLVLSNAYIFVKMKKNDFDFKTFIKGPDECLASIRNRIFKEGYFVIFGIIMFIDILYLVLMILGTRIGVDSRWVESLTINYGGSFAIFFIPGIYISFTVVRKGLFIPVRSSLTVEGKVKNKEFNIKKFRIRCLLGAIWFGVIMGLMHPGHFKILEFLKITVITGGTWGIIFYVLMIGLMKVSKKAADKRADK